MKPICQHCQKPIEAPRFHQWVLRQKVKVNKTGQLPVGPYCSKECYGKSRKEQTQRELKMMVDKILKKKNAPSEITL